MKVAAGIILTFLLGAMFVSLFHLSTSMDMSGGMSDCPYMSHEEVVCPMNVADHIGAWKSVFAAATPMITLLLVVAGLVAVVSAVAPNLLFKARYISPKRYVHPREYIYTFSYRTLQELFSNGVLHTKLF